MPAHALPSALGTFFGRDAELAELRARFDAGARLVTVVGPGGVGKTRLACEYAAREARPVVFVDLSEARDRAELLDALARALDAPSPRGAAAEHQRVGRALAARGATLLVLDNFEQLVGDAAVLTRLLAAAPEACVLATSRERLRLAREQLLELGPLATGAHDGAPAIELFLDRVRARRGLGAPDAAERTRAATIVHALDGLPLAIELAAQRGALLGLAAVEAWLDRALDLAAAGPRDAPDRQRTMRRALEGSWQSLADDERAALAACAAFRGSFTATAFAAVAPGGLDALDALQRLREKSLVAAAAGDARLRVLALVRAYVREQTPPALLVRLAARHAAHFEAAASRATPPGWVLDEWDNLAAALEHAMAAGARDRAAALLVATGETALRAGHVATLLERLATVLPAGAALAPGLACDLWLLRARAEERRVRYAAAREAYARAHACAEASGEPGRRARVLRVQSMGLAGAGQLDEARALFDRATALSAAHDADATYGAFDVLGLASALWQANRMGEARALLERYVPVAATEEDRALAQAECGIVDLALGHFAGAADQLRAAAEVFARAGWRAEMARCEVLLGLTAYQLEAFADAEAHFVRSAALALDARDGAGGAARGRAGYARGYLGVLWLERGRGAREVRAMLEAGRAGVPDAGHGALFAAYLAACDAATGDIESARATWKIAHATDVAPCLRGAIEALGLWVTVAAASARARADARPLRAALARASHALGGAERAQAETRLALRVVRALLARRDAAGAARTGVLEVQAGGAWFRRDRRSRVDLARHGNARRALVCLAEARVVAPGGTVPWSTLVARVWPGEAILASAAKNRLRVTLALLRKAGLGDLLVTDTAGYRLDAGVDVRFVGAALGDAARAGARTG